jgi:hypothetical protein
MTDMPGKLFRRGALLLGLSIGGGLLGYGVWKAWPVGAAVYRAFATTAHYKSLPDPVVVKDGVYWFPLADRVFAVPKAYVVSYGRNSTDGSLNNFSLHALLPDFASHSPETAEKFKVRGWGDRIDIRVYAVRSISQDEVEEHYYKNYLFEKESLKKRYGQDPVVVSKNPHVEKISTNLSDYFYIIEGNHVKKKLHCANKDKKIPSYPYCNDIAMFYRDNIYLYVTYSRIHEKDWIAIDDRLVTWLESFERPVEDFPQPIPSSGA